MENIMFSACDSKFFDVFAIKMYSSFKKFNPNTKMYFGNINCSEEQLVTLKKLGVTIVTTKELDILKNNKLSLNFIDWLMYDYLKDIKYDKVMWIDIDTLILQNLEELFDIESDFVGHPGRNQEGAILTEDNRIRFALGLWVGNKKVIKLLFINLFFINNISVESSLVSRILHFADITVHQLDPSIWNFSRDLVKLAEKDGEGKIYYKVYPKTVGFSKLDNHSRGELK